MGRPATRHTDLRTRRKQGCMIDATTLRALWDEHADRLLLIARAMGEPAEDAVQEAFIALATQAQPPEDPLAWLATVARNRIRGWRRSWLRRRRRETEVSKGPWLSGSTILVDQKIDGDQITAALMRMPSPQREIIVMHLWGDMTFESIAGVVGGSRATAHRNFQHGIAKLREQFNPHTEAAVRV